MLLWDRGSTTIPAGWKPCLLGRGNPKAPRHFVNNVALGAQSPLCTEIKARLLPCLPLSYAAISGQPCGYPVKMSSGSVVDPVDGLSLVAAKRVNESDASAGNVRANGKFSWRGRTGRDLKRNHFVSRKAQSNTPEKLIVTVPLRIIPMRLSAVKIMGERRWLGTCLSLH